MNLQQLFGILQLNSRCAKNDLYLIHGLCFLKLLKNFLMNFSFLKQILRINGGSYNFHCRIHIFPC